MPSKSHTTRTAKQWKPANLNDQIRFKLKPKGERFIAHLNRTHRVYSKHPITLKPDAHGWCEMILWEFASIFGSTFGMGFDQTVETSIELRSNA